MVEVKNSAAPPDCAKPAVPATRKPGLGRVERFGRTEILGKYWELANLDPEITKGTITGQLKALDSLCQELALEESDDEATGQPKQQIYRSAWMRETAREAPDKELRTVAAPRGKSATVSKRSSSARTRSKAADDE